MRILTTGAILVLLMVIAVNAVTLPSAPRLINYQGRLTDAAGTPLPDGAKSVRFIIWNDPTLTAPGNEVWNSGPLTVTTTSGLFSVFLGGSPQPALTPDLLMDTMRWMGITVGADPELSPRTRLVAVPYAFNAQNALYADSSRTTGSSQFVRVVGDTMTGNLSFDNDALGVDAWLENTATGANLRLYHDAVLTATLYGMGGYGTLELKNNMAHTVVNLDANRSYGGILFLYQQDGTNGVILNGGTTSDGSTLNMYNAGGTNTITLDADLTGNSAAALPEGAISATEMFNEPGIAAAHTTSTIYFNSSDMTDIITVTITTPSTGYIIVEGKTIVRLSGTRGANYAYVQIDETSGGLTTSPYFASSGFDSTVTTGLSLRPAFVQRIYSKSAGSYTFRLEGLSFSGAGPGASTGCYNSMITAQFFPTSYGTVETMLSTGETGGFERIETVEVEGESRLVPEGTPTVYKADLRELELRAAKAEAEAERAQRELAEAQRKQVQDSNRR